MKKIDNLENFNYKSKSRLIAFTLSFAFGILGVDWFYLSAGSLTYVIIGIIKMIFGVIGLVIPCFLRCLRSDGSNIIGLSIFIIFVFSMTISTFSWWIADLFRISNNMFKDGNNQNLSE